jgi:hypothetical protein
MSFEVKLKRLGQRDWDEVKSAWLAPLSQLTFSKAGLPPDAALSDFYDLGEVAGRIPQDGEYRENITGLRAAVLHEGVYLLHKAANVLVGSHTQVVGGLPTWSVATAYQSAFFSMEAIFRLLGVAVVEVNNKTFMLDVWPEAEKTASKRAKALYKLGDEMQFVSHKRIDHYHRWALLKRALRMLTNSPIRGEIINALDAIDDKDFARQRNMLHYSNIWLFDDLHTFYSPLSYCRFNATPPLVQRLDPGHQDFTVVLATILLSSAASLLAALGQSAPIMQNEWKLLNEACSNQRLSLRAEFENSMQVSLV